MAATTAFPTLPSLPMSAFEERATKLSINHPWIACILTLLRVLSQDTLELARARNAVELFQNGSKNQALTQLTLITNPKLQTQACADCLTKNHPHSQTTTLLHKLWLANVILKSNSVAVSLLLPQYLNMDTGNLLEVMMHYDKTPIASEAALKEFFAKTPCDDVPVLLTTAAQTPQDKRIQSGVQEILVRVMKTYIKKQLSQGDVAHASNFIIEHKKLFSETEYNEIIKAFKDFITERPPPETVEDVENLLIAAAQIPKDIRESSLAQQVLVQIFQTYAEQQVSLMVDVNTLLQKYAKLFSTEDFQTLSSTAFTSQRRDVELLLQPPQNCAAKEYYGMSPGKPYSQLRQEDLLPVNIFEDTTNAVETQLCWDSKGNPLAHVIKGTGWQP